jgi:predicted DNA-binding transcriptional regulator AlpA
MIARNSMQPEWLRITAATDNFGISRSGIYRLAGDGEIELRKIGARTVVNVTSLRSFIERQPKLTPRQDPIRKKQELKKTSSKIGIQNSIMRNKSCLPSI